MAISSFADAMTEDLFDGRRVARIGPVLAKRARIKLALLDQAAALGDLASPGNDLKLLQGVNPPTWQIRVNQQYRIRFTVERDAPLELTEVRFGDFH